MANITVKNVPDELHALLKESAKKNRRSLKTEVLIRLESGFTAPLVGVQEQGPFRRVRRL
jgi:antitoxin FitA